MPDTRENRYKLLMREPRNEGAVSSPQVKRHYVTKFHNPWAVEQCVNTFRCIDYYHPISIHLCDSHYLVAVSTRSDCKGTCTSDFPHSYVKISNKYYFVEEGFILAHISDNPSWRR